MKTPYREISFDMIIDRDVLKNNHITLFSVLRHLYTPNRYGNVWNLLRQQLVVRVARLYTRLGPLCLATPFLRSAWGQNVEYKMGKKKKAIVEPYLQTITHSF